MINKLTRLSQAFRNESIKRIPYIIIILALLLLWQNYNNGRKANTTLGQIAKLSEKVQQLGEDNKALSQQNRDLSKQNKDLSQKQVDYTKCGFELFAKFTRDGQPIAIQDLARCVFSSPSTSSSPASSALVASQRQSPGNVLVSSSPSQSVLNTDNKQAENQTPPTPSQPNIIQRIIQPVQNLIKRIKL